MENNKKKISFNFEHIRIWHIFQNKTREVLCVWADYHKSFSTFKIYLIIFFLLV